MAAMRACSTPGHSHLLREGERCPEKPAWGGTSQRQRTGRPGLDQATRLRILRRDLYTCQGCGKGQANHVDHIEPRGDGGTDDDDNLQTLCSDCHERKSGREGARARASAEAAGEGS